MGRRKAESEDFTAEGSDANPNVAALRVQTTIRPCSAPERKVRGAGQMSTNSPSSRNPTLSVLGVKQFFGSK
jgi:hypothetical protein